MIYYPLSVLMLAGICDILLITTLHDQPLFQQLLGDGAPLGVRISYAVQPRPEGLAQAFIGNDRVALVLGDNIFYGHSLSELLSQAIAYRGGASIFAYEVADPERYGIVTFDAAGRATSIVEKLAAPLSNYAVTGLYFYDNDVVHIAREIEPSARSEMEITSVNQTYLEAGKLNVIRMGRGFAWLDTGTVDSLLAASEFVATLEQRQGLKICCPEEIALRQGFTTLPKMAPWLERLGKSEYAKYICQIAPSNPSYPVNSHDEQAGNQKHRVIS